MEPVIVFPERKANGNKENTKDKEVEHKKKICRDLQIHRIGKCNEFKYLGFIISEDGTTKITLK